MTLISYLKGTGGSLEFLGSKHLIQHNRNFLKYSSSNTAIMKFIAVVFAMLSAMAIAHPTTQDNVRMPSSLRFNENMNC